MSRIALFGPHHPEHISGNSTSLRRIARGLRRAGHDVMELGPGPAPGAAIDPATLRGFDLFHAFHAFRTGIAVRRAALHLETPYVVSITGTDIHDDIAIPGKREAIAEVLRDAAALLAGTAEMRARAIAMIGASVPCVLVPKGVELPDPEPLHPAGAEGAGRGLPLFLHVAGWREVKNNLFPLEPLSRLAAEAPGVRLRFIGPALDPAHHARWLEAAPRYPFAEDGGAVEPARMPAEYRAASVVLNTSHSEGGSNAVLEAMAAGRAVLASDIPGNAAFIRHDEGEWETSTGILYRTVAIPGPGPARQLHDAADFLRKARRLALDPSLRARIGRNARECAAREHSPERELAGVLEAYRVAGIA